LKTLNEERQKNKKGQMVAGSLTKGRKGKETMRQEYEAFAQNEEQA